MRCGDTLLIPAPGKSSRTPHLWIILTEPDPECVVVSLTTLKGSKDQTVTLRPGDHPFIRHATVAFYAFAEIVDITHLAQQVENGFAVMHSPCPAGTLKLLQSGIHASPHTAKKIQKFCRKRGV
jgi:hypothetical protein